MSQPRSIVRASLRALGVAAFALALAAAPAGAASVWLHWTAPGDDATIGRASAYDLRYSTQYIMPDQFAQATVVSGLPVPSACGHQDSCLVDGLTAGVGYCFALRTRDDAFNWSALSNVVVRVVPGPLAAEPGTLALAFGPPRPNPARGATRFAFALPAGGALDVAVFDAGGRRVRVLAAGSRGPGAGELIWDLTDDAGGAIPSGWYAIRAQLPGRTIVRRVVVTR